jgi:hypothetical protein
VTFAEIRDRRKIGDIEFYTKQPFKAEVIPGLEPKQRFDYPARKPFGGKGGGKGGRSDRGDRGFGGQAKGWGNRSEGRFEGQGRGGDFRGGDRFEPRFDPRKDGARQEPRFEARHDPRFEQGPARDGWSAPRGAHPRAEQDRAPRGFGHPNERFERRDDRAPRSFDKPHAPRAQARAGGNDRFDRASRGPKVIGGGFKPHAPKRKG